MAQFADDFLTKLKKARTEKRLRTVFRNRLLPLFWVTNPAIHENQLHYYEMKRIKKKYNHLLDNDARSIDDYFHQIEAHSSQKKVLNNKIWVCWFQGVDNAPPLVKTCIHSLRKIKGYEVTVITAENWDSYAAIPAFIVEKWQTGKISNTHMSDILRLALLVQHGGLWIDATVLYDGDGGLPSYFTSSNLFFYSNLLRGDLSSVGSNWLICAKPDNQMLRLTLYLLYRYWEKNNHAVYYFIFHYFLKLAFDRHPAQWEKLPKVSSVDPHLMCFELFDSATPARIKRMEETSVFHKLSYKLDFSLDKDGSLYQYILNNY